jgi:hypothetical protein
VTYITPDFVALEQEAKRYAVHHRLPQGPAFSGGRGFRGEVIPLLAAAPVPPLTMPITRSWKMRDPPPNFPLVTSSPLEQDYQDALPGSMLHGLGEVTLPAKYVVPAVLVIAALWWESRRRR